MKKLLTIVVNDPMNNFHTGQAVWLSLNPNEGFIGAGMIANAREQAPKFTAEQVEWLKRVLPVRDITLDELLSFYDNLELVREEDVQPE